MGRCVRLVVCSDGAAEYTNGLQPAKVSCMNFHVSLHHRRLYQRCAQPADNSRLLSSPLLNSSPGKLSSWGTTSKTFFARALKTTCFHSWPDRDPHAVIPPLGGYPVSLNFGDSSRDISDIIWIRRRIYFHRGHRKQPACLLDTKQTSALPAKRAPIRDYQKDAASSPAYYFQFLLEKVNLMSIIGS